MSSTEVIRHDGIVESIAGDSLTVRILQASACSSCSARQLCRSSESKEKLVDVTGHYPTLRVGDKVTLSGSVHQGLRATLLAYALPIVLMVVVLFVTANAFGEGIAAMATLLTLALYYGLLFLLRDKISRQFTFKIEKD